MRFFLGRALVVLVTFSSFDAFAAIEDDFTFRLPSTLTLSGASSNTGTKSGGGSLQLMLPKNYWISGAVDQAVEETDGLETKTLGGSVSVGTDPLAEYSLDAGFDGSSVESQYRVQEGRLRMTAMPDSILGWKNGGLEVSGELRAARFSFANTSNPIFQSSEVQLETRTERLELGWYGWSHWSWKLWTEQTQLADAFKELARPLAPLFIPVAAISTALSWTAEEYGTSLGYAARRWGLRLLVAKKRAAVSGDNTWTTGLSGDFKWTSRITSGVRISSSAVNNDSSNSVSSDPIYTGGVDLSFTF